MTALPPIYYLHVWWARRPLVVSRAAVLASLLPADADQERFLRVIGIHGDPVAARERIEIANRKGERLGSKAYGYSRAFSYTPDHEDREWIATTTDSPVVLDPTAGGGSVPFETVRLGIGTLANDLNPVAALIERATLEWPATFGTTVARTLIEIGSQFAAQVRERLAGVFPNEPKRRRSTGWLSVGADGSVSPTAAEWCRCRRIGDWRVMGPAYG